MVSIVEFKPNEAVFKDIEREFARELAKRQNAGKIAAGALVGSALVASGAFATGGGASGGVDPNAAATTVAGGVTAAKTMLAGIDSVTISVFAIALTPIGFMLTLSVLNRVLSRV